MADPTTDSQAAPADATSTAASPADASQSQAATPDTGAAPAAGDDAKPAEPGAAKTDDAPAEPAEPAKEVVYDFKLPDGVDLKGEAIDELKATAKEFGLTQEQAQRIADLGVKQAQGFAAQLVEQQKTMTAEWAEQTTSDKEIGGDALPENLGVAKKALDTFGSPALTIYA